MNNTFNLSQYLRDGWGLFTANIANLVVATIILIAVNFAASFVPLGTVVVEGPMAGGMFYVILDLMRGEPFKPARLFDGFAKKLVPLALVGILTSVFSTLGFIFLIFPGFLVMGWYFFSYLFVVDKDMDFWPAMEASRRIGFENHLNVFLMALVLLIINFFGAVALLVGLLVTIPFTMCVVVKAYESLSASAPSAFAGGPTSEPPPPPPPPSPMDGPTPTIPT